MKCRDCATEDPHLHYRSGRMQRCYDCQNYLNITTKRTGGEVHFTREEFVSWKRSRPRTCYYCGIDQQDLALLGVVNPRTGRIMESIGVDRIDNHGDYALENLVPCCGACNAIKSSILSSAEMQGLGPALSIIWEKRLNAPPTSS